MADKVDSRLLAKLAEALGFILPESQARCQPYLDYIQNQWHGKGTKPEYLRLYVDVVGFFNTHSDLPIQSYIDKLTTEDEHFYFADTPARSEIRKMAVTDSVLLILGTWTLLRSYFVSLHGRQRHILLIPTLRSDSLNPLDQPLSRLIDNSGLMPHPSEASGYEEPATQQHCVELNAIHPSTAPQSFPLHSSAGLVESLSITAQDLNLIKLTRLAHVRVLWTDNVSRHLLLSRRSQKWYLELFALPCTLQSGTQVGLSVALADEIEASYANLFNPHAHSPFSSWVHMFLGKIVGLQLWCWCLTCSSRRLRAKELTGLKHQTMAPRSEYRGERRRANWMLVNIPYDPSLRELAKHEATWWDQTEFENLWPRILTLERCLQEAKPWSFWVLLRDNRDTVQYWTFLFGTVILVFTMAQVILGILQVVSSSSPSSQAG